MAYASFSNVVQFRYVLLEQPPINSTALVFVDCIFFSLSHFVCITTTVKNQFGTSVKVYITLFSSRRANLRVVFKEPCMSWRAVYCLAPPKIFGSEMFFRLDFPPSLVYMLLLHYCTMFLFFDKIME